MNFRINYNPTATDSDLVKVGFFYHGEIFSRITLSLIS